MAKQSKKSDTQDIENRQEKNELEERIQFEELLSDLSATFVNLPTDAIDKEIDHGLELVVKFLGADRGILLQFSEDDQTLNLTHFYVAPDTKPLPFTFMTPSERHFWYTEVLQNGEMLVMENLPDDLPKEAIVEKQFCIEQGIKSHLAIPLSIGKAHLIGVVGFGFLRNRQTWPTQLLQRVQFVGHIFASILRRKQTEDELARAFAKIKELKERLEAENIYLKEEIKIESSYGEILGHSSAIKAVLSQVEQVADTDSTVLIQGETGTGKELLARAIHKLSPRNGKAMIRVNCAVIPPTLIESELFGHEKGAYTGASSKQVGRFEIANGSTIFLDEIGELSGSLQAKLLNVLEQGQFERLGSPDTVSIDVR
ncbi:MAG: sigma 54-interacting transcriptional regulator, partial [Planctomycetota bacterium]